MTRTRAIAAGLGLVWQTATAWWVVMAMCWRGRRVVRVLGLSVMAAGWTGAAVMAVDV